MTPSNQSSVLVAEDEPATTTLRATTLDSQQAGASFGPAAMKAMGLAFDQAWAEISSHFEENGKQSQTMRLKLAKAVLSVANEDSRNVELLKNEALQLMALSYRA